MDEAYRQRPDVSQYWSFIGHSANKGLLKKPDQLPRSWFQVSKSDKLATNRAIDDCCNC